MGGWAAVQVCVGVGVSRGFCVGVDAIGFGSPDQRARPHTLDGFSHRLQAVTSICCPGLCKLGLARETYFLALHTDLQPLTKPD